MGRKILSVAVTVLLLIAPFAAAFGQTAGKGAITGTLTDSQGAVVADVTVKATNIATNVTYTTTSTDAGLYRFVDLPAGDYTVSIEASGFKPAKIENLVVSVGQVVTQNLELTPGAPTETVTITASGEQLVQASEASLSTLLNKKVWESYPLENRDSNEFIDLLPGAVPDAIAGSTRGAAVNGARGGMGNFMVDGYDNNDQGQGGRGSTVAGGVTSISPEAIHEYRIITNTYSAQYGKAGGFVADTVLKSGANQYHGSLFEYNRVQALAANDFFSNREGIEDSLVRNQFGGSFGGPIFKDKTFYFVTAEWHKLRQGSPVTATSLTREFFDFVDSGAFADFIEDELCGGTCPGAFSRSRTVGPNFRQLAAVTFPNGIPFATKDFTNAAAGLFTDGIIYPVPVYGQVTVTSNNKFDQYRISTKVDHSFSTIDRISGTFLIENPDTTTSVIGGDSTIGPPIVTDARRINIGISYTHTFGPTIVNEVKASYLRNRADFPQLDGFDRIPSVVTGIDPLALAFGQSSALPQFFTDRQFQIQDHLSIIKGAHSFRVGGEYRRTFNASAFEATKNGFFLPHGVEELLTDGAFGDEADAVFFGEPMFGGFTFAQASIDPTTGGLPEFYRGYRANEWGFYVQDDWKVRPNLTLNLGLRWEYFGPPHNFRKGIDSNFYFGDATTPVPNPSDNIFFPSDSPLIARLVNGDFQQRDNEIWQKDTNNFAPRIGIAWDVFNNQKLVVRGGAGQFYDRIWNNLFENIRFNAPFFAFSTIGAFGNGLPAGPISTPGLFTVPFTSTGLFADPANLPAPSPRHMDENLLTPFLYQAFAGVQYELTKNDVVEANYITTLGRKLSGVVNINTFNGRTSTGGRMNGSTRRPNPELASDNFRTNAFSSSYHGLQFIFRHRTQYGLQLNANYTFSKAIDSISDAFNARLGLNPMDNFNIGLDRGRADFDIRHKFVTDFSYEIPLWKDHRWLGGWEATGILTLQSGAPFSVIHGNEDANADGIFTDRAIFLGSGEFNDTINDDVSPADGYFDPSNFVGVITRAGQVGPATACGPGNGVILSDTQWWCNGTTGRNIISGPGFANFDFGIHKRFKVTENTSLQFQANAFNLFNHPNFGLPARDLNNAATVGRSTFTVGTPRVMQLALRFDF
ncbi:MAG TPA: TonB-dependent receptor [Blastocatellia bacterium]|jgi:hypothetical protein|nr:TonB-dependent receptor [Blastocatellia bacterium]